MRCDLEARKISKCVLRALPIVRRVMSHRQTEATARFFEATGCVFSPAIDLRAAKVGSRKCEKEVNKRQFKKDRWINSDSLLR
jgi:hypothetical protein